MLELYHQIEGTLFGADPRSSVPIKHGTADTRRLTPVNSPTKSITSRLATALIVAAQAQGVDIRPGGEVKRAFSFDGGTWAIENGCGQDILSCGAAQLVAGRTATEDVFVLTPEVVAWIASEASRHAWNRG